MATDALPSFSVIVPTYGRPRRLRACLEALSRLRYPRYEVIVVDDGSGERAAHRVAEAATRFDVVTLVRQRNAGPAAARNTGAQQAMGTYLAFTDDDCRPSPDWLRALSRQLEEQPHALIGGRTVNALRHNVFAEASQALTSFLSAKGDGGRFFASSNIALSRAAFLEHGGFDDRFSRAAGEDRAFCAQWHARGGQSVYAPEAVVWHAHPLTFQSFLRQQFNYGRGAYRFHERKNAAPVADSDAGWLPQPPEFYLGLVLNPLKERHRSVAKKTALCLLMLAAQGAVAAGLLAEALSL